jgi:hypothetical protein
VTRSANPPLSLPEEHAKALAEVDLPNLGSLSLCGYELSLNDLLDLLAAPWVGQLHTLKLRSCNFNRHAVPVIAGLEWPRLGLLDLRDNTLAKEEQALLRERFGVRVRY